jgi:uncharacterized membrane-anchored protein YhcB (DUF1043 family)
MMSYPPSHYGSDPESSGSFDDYETAEEAWRAQRRRESYLPAVFIALVIGAIIGALLSRRQRRPKEPAEVAKEWLENAYAQLSEKLPQIAEKIPQLAEKIPHLTEKIPHLTEKIPHLTEAKNATAQWCQAAFLEQANQLGKKLKWW